MILRSCVLALALASAWAQAAPPTLAQQGASVAATEGDAKPAASQVAAGEGAAKAPATVAAKPSPRPAPAPVRKGPPSPAAAVPKVAPPVAAKAPVPERKAPQWMPGFANGIPGDPEAAKPNVVYVGLDRSEIIQISANFANRIATPFRAPKATGIIDTEVVVIEQAGQSLFVQSRSDAPIALFITDEALPNSPVLSVTLMPRPNLPPQTVVLQTQGVSLTQDVHKKAEVSESYVGMLRDWLRLVAAGRAPRGYIDSSLRGAVGVVGPLIVRPTKRFAGARFDIYHYVIEAGDKVVEGSEVEIDEDSFNAEGVRAVAIFPRQRLARGDMTNVYVVSEKPDADRAASTLATELR